VEVPHLKAIHKKYAGKGLKIIAVDAGHHDTKDYVAKFVHKQNIPYTVLLDGRPVFKKHYLEISIPQTYLIDRSGIIRYRHDGWREGDEKKLEKEIAELLKA